MPKKSKDKKIEVSPLLSKSDGPKSEMKVPNMGMASPFHSTVNSEKFDMRRFSDRRDDEESSLKIVIYVVLVIIIGVGLALFVRQVISNNESSEPTTENETTVEEDPSNVTINTEGKSDSLAPTSAAESYVFGSEETTTLGSDSSTEVLAVGTLAYDRYSTFGQLSLGFQDGLALESVPQITTTYNATNKQIKIVLPESTTVDEEIQGGAVISDAISSVSYNDATKTFTISLSEETTHRTTLISVGSTPTLILDVKVVEEEETPVVEETTTETTTEVETDAPTTQTLDNEYSQEKQFIVSSVTGNTVPLDKTYFTDDVDNFELAFGKVGNLGPDYIPNATAELVVEDGVNYIDLTIRNLSSFEFNGVKASQTGLDLSAANFVRADLSSFEGGTAVIRIQLKNAADFKISSDTTLNGQTQVLSLRIKD